MREFEYVPRAEWKPVKDDLVEMIHDIQLVLKYRNSLTFSYSFVGSSKRGMITREVNGNRGYDFDIDIRVNDDGEEYSAEELKDTLRNVIDYIGQFHGYEPGEDSTRVITIKHVDRLASKILYSCDFAIVNDYSDENDNLRQEFVFFDKESGQYCWRQRSREYCNLKQNEDRIKAAGKWSELREVYLEKKCRYSYEKESRALYVEAVHEVISRL